MKLLHELIPSPRAGKRFINIYRLVRASVGDRERAAFIGDTKGGEHQCALILLAILTGHPVEATEILRDLIQHEHKDTWWTFIESLKKRRPQQPADSPKKDRRQKLDSQPTIDGVHVHKASREMFEPRWEELFGKLDRLRPVVKDHPCTVFAKWAPRIARYSFQSGRVLLHARQGSG